MFAKSGEKTLFAAQDAIITPSAWDEAKELAITIETCSDKKADDVVMQGTGTGSVNPDFLARVVGEVIACLQQTKQELPLQTETDPCGLKLIRGDRLIFSGAVTGSPQDKIQVAELAGAKESKQISANFMKMDDTSFSTKTVSDETIHIVEGKLECTVNGKHYRGSAGDSFFIPAHQQITLSTSGKAACFSVVSAVR